MINRWRFWNRRNLVSFNPPTKLREGNMLTHVCVCLFVCSFKESHDDIRYSIIEYIILILDYLIKPLLICLVKEQNNENIHNREIQGQMADYQTSFRKFCDFGEIVMKFGWLFYCSTWNVRRHTCKICASFFFWQVWFGQVRQIILTKYFEVSSFKRGNTGDIYVNIVVKFCVSWIFELSHASG